jgi:hypothetical protein
MTISGSDRFIAIVSEDGTIKIPLNFAAAGTSLQVVRKSVRVRQKVKKIKPLAFAEKFKGFLKPEESADEKYRHILKKHA